jgi:hypothetical protein
MRRLSRIFQLKIRAFTPDYINLISNVCFTTKSQISITIGPLNKDEHYSAINFNNRHIIGLTSSEWKVESALKMERQNVILYILEISRTKRLF